MCESKRLRLSPTFKATETTHMCPFQYITMSQQDCIYVPVCLHTDADLLDLPISSSCGETWHIVSTQYMLVRGRIGHQEGRKHISNNHRRFMIRGSARVSVMTTEGTGEIKAFPTRGHVERFSWRVGI